MKSLKKTFLDKMHQIVDERIINHQSAITSVSESRNTASKSSAGDKHETSRALMQTELNKIEKQLVATLELKQRLLQMPDKTSQTGYGSLVKTDKGLYYLSIGLGKISVSGNSFFAVSPASPLGNVFLGVKKGEVVRFRNEIYKIEDVF